jgi:hypothetical protein
MRPYIILLIIVVFGFSCGEKRIQRDLILLRTLAMATDTYQEQNQILTNSIEFQWALDANRIQVYKEWVKKVNSFANTFNDYSKSSNSIDQIKDKYLQTIDSLFMTIGPFEIDYTYNKFQPIVDSTIQYFESNEQLFVQKMRFDIYRIAYSINTEIAHNISTTDFRFVPLEAKVKPLDSTLKKGDKFTGLLYTPHIENGYSVTIIDKVTLNGKHNLSYNLTRVESVLQIDSTLVIGEYSIEGSAIFNSGWNWKSTPFKYSFKVK